MAVGREHLFMLYFTCCILMFLESINIMFTSGSHVCVHMLLACPLSLPTLNNVMITTFPCTAQAAVGVVTHKYIFTDPQELIW